MRRTCVGQTAIGLAVALSVIGTGAQRADAQAPGSAAQVEPQRQEPPTFIPQVRFNSGQSVVPYYEGWIRNADGSFDIVFGYFNRNWQQELAIPAGPDNKVEPFGGDAGQPTYFLPRRQRWIYRLRVPADFGNREVTWTITANGHTEKVVASLIPAEEINERVVASNGNFDTGVNDPNKAPALTVPASLTATVGASLTLTATATDDGLPKPRNPPAPRPTAQGQSTFGGQINSSGGTRPRGLTLRWIEYRGPAKAIFDAAGPVSATSGQPITTTVRFTAPGTYILRAAANDGALSTIKDVSVTVSASPSTDNK
jgi:hypothetical protein